MAKVSRVLSVDLRGLRKTDPQLLIAAEGQVPTSGWSDGELSEYIYVVPPEDGIYEFDFVAKPPSGPVIQVVSPIFASDMTKWHRGIKGIKVYAAENSVTVRLLTIAAPPKTKGDPFNVDSAKIVGDQLHIDVSYSGGCARHDFELYWDGSYDKSQPPRANLMLIHDANDDPCDAIIRETIRFDLFQLAPCVLVVSSGFGYEEEILYGYSRDGGKDASGTVLDPRPFLRCS